MYKLVERNGKKIALVDMLTEQSKLFSDLVKKTILKYKKLGKKILFITNRKGYTSSSMCLDCWFVPKCEFCDVPIWKYVVDWNYVYMCPICRRIYEDFSQCKNCGSYNVKEIWIWTYKLQEILQNEFAIDALVIENTQINSIWKIKKIIPEFGNAQFVISTNILSYPSNFVPDIIIFPNADTGLTIPDFNVAEKHFLFLYEFLKNYPTQNYIIQTFNFEHYVYQNLVKMDLDWFWQQELKYRKMLFYPPFAELAVLIYKHQVEEKLYLKISKIESELKYLIQNLNAEVEIFPTPQLVFKKFWKYHYNIILKWTNLKSFLDKAVELLKLRQKWFQIDWMPMNLV